MEYGEIRKLLRLSEEADTEAADVLDALVEKPDVSRLNMIMGGCVIVFGAGPSLKEDLKRVKVENLEGLCVFIAAGGAVKALLEEKIVPQVQVTDLDGDKEAILEADRKGAVSVVHAHGDNIEAMKELVPRMRGVIGTAQVPGFGKLKDFGGFTDGDRAVYLAEHFKADLIALAGMDFGENIGDYSGSKNIEFTRKKLAVGKKLLEELAEKSNASIVNLTSGGEELKGIHRMSVKELKGIAIRLR